MSALLVKSAWDVKMNIQTIVKNCTIDDIRAWDMSAVDGFKLTRASSFEPGAQGLALAKLATHKKGELVMQCAFPEPVSADEFEACLLGGPFGISLIRHAKVKSFGQENKAASEAFDRNLANFYLQRGGLLGKGQSCALVCVDPAHKLPSMLRAYAKNEDKDFPLDESDFRQMLASMAAAMGFRSFLNSSTESSLNSFVFECFVNSQEHGQSSKNKVARQGVRALLIEKVVVSATTKLDKLSKGLQEYIARATESPEGKLGLGLVCLTVSDQGDGIQVTLPPVSPNESAKDRFARAFVREVTRKPQGAIKRGLGLSHALSAAHKMRARIEIHSSGIHYVQDFSLGESPYPELDKDAIAEDDLTRGSGTSVSIWVPEYASGLDQPDMFDQKNLPPAA
ncbi:hypothetical protein [Chitinimonas sp. BJYL2]|uniref:hypothetical protein n=1 Tax=Chitinimonas sp. BJYL2 TaxID=2976696 RepID=UPI0022B5D47C|nr:hypothetical protein [Chitinimonas sp. BJYL2]